MKKVIRINNMENIYTNEKGSLIMYLNRYSKEAWKNRGENINFYGNANIGVNIFFLAENSKEAPSYIKSLVLTPNEIKLIFQGKIDIVNDLNFILSWGKLVLSIYNFGSYDTHTLNIKENGCNVVECGLHRFTIANIEEFTKKSPLDGLGTYFKTLFNIHDSKIENLTDSLCNYTLDKYEVVYDFNK